MTVILDRPRYRGAHIAIALAILVVVVAGGIAYERLASIDPGLHAVSQPQLMAFPSVSPTEQRQGPAPATAPVETAPTRAPAPVIPPEQRGATVDQLMASSKPEHALQAFAAIDRCTRAKGLALQSAPEANLEPAIYDKSLDDLESCAGLSRAHLAARTRLLIRAGEAGVPGAFAAAYDSDDPEVREAYARIQDASIRKGDAEAMGIKAAEIVMGCGAKCSSQQIAEAVKLSTAAQILRTADGANTGPLDTMDPLTAQLDRATAAQAIEKGKQLAIEAKEIPR